MSRGTAVLLLWMRNCQEHGSTREGMAGRRDIISHTNIPLLYAWYGTTSGQLGQNCNSNSIVHFAGLLFSYTGTECVKLGLHFWYTQ